MSYLQYNIDTINNIINFLTNVATPKNMDAQVKLAAYKYILNHRNFKKYGDCIHEMLSWNNSPARIYTWIDNIRSVIELLNSRRRVRYFDFHTYECKKNFNYRYYIGESSLTSVDMKVIKTTKQEPTKEEIAEDFSYVKSIIHRYL